MKTHILLVDDDRDELAIFIEALDATGIEYKCTWAKSGEQALSQLQYITPHFIFLDLNLPGMNGFETLGAIKKMPLLTTTPVVLYSNGMTEDAVNKGMALGATGCLQKPDSIPLLAQALQSLFKEEHVLL